MQATLNLYYTRELYKPVRTDQVDVAMAQYINSRLKTLEIPFVREETGVYKFGFRRVFVKLENGVLSIRVGGGYMRIEEFIELYTPVEIDRLLAKCRETPDGSPFPSGECSPIVGQSETRHSVEGLEEGKFITMFTRKRSPRKTQPRKTLKRSTTMAPFEFSKLVR